MKRPSSPVRRTVNLLDAIKGVTSGDIQTAEKVLKEFFHVGVVYNKPSRRFAVTLTGYGQRSYLGVGATLFDALETAFRTAEAANET